MILREALIRLCNENINQTNDWYSWRKIDETKLPGGISLPEGNQYQKNIALKLKLNQLWIEESDVSRQEELIKYYISTWGGIRRNSRSRIREYTVQHPNQLFEKGKAGVASWSKALVVRDPNQYAVFDARVSVSINAIQIIDDLNNIALYPILPSRNVTIANANRRIKEFAIRDDLRKLSSSDFYRSYLELLCDVASTCNTNIATVEMLLFSKAEEFASRIN